MTAPTFRPTTSAPPTPRVDVVFADEPTDALDTTSAANLLTTLAHMCTSLGQTVVMVTHDDEHAAATINRIVRLHDGHITGDQPIHHTPNTPHTAPADHPAPQAPPAHAHAAPMATPAAPTGSATGLNAATASTAVPAPVRRPITPPVAPESHRVSRPDVASAPLAPHPTARHAAAPSATQTLGFGNPNATGMEAR